MALLTRSAILRISDEKTLELIRLYKNEECLWNTNSKDYKDKVERALATDRIAQRLRLANFDAYHVIFKFKNLRNSYCQELKKIGKSMKAGDEVYKPKVFWFDEMDSFLRPHLQKSRTSPFIIHDNDELSKDSGESGEYLSPKAEPVDPEEFEEAEETKEWMENSNNEEVITPSPALESCSDDDDPLVVQRLSSVSQIPSKRHVEDHSCYDENSSAKMFKRISSQLEVLANPRDDTFDTFGKYIASLLRNMPAKKALNLQPKIVSLVANSALKKDENRVSQSGQRN